MIGKVKQFNKIRGFGFIRLDDDREVFFHYSSLVMEGFKMIDEGILVEFDLIETPRGLQAQNIVKV